jgi:hypothetical protein
MRQLRLCAQPRGGIQPVLCVHAGRLHSVSPPATRVAWAV